MSKEVGKLIRNFDEVVNEVFFEGAISMASFVGKILIEKNPKFDVQNKPGKKPPHFLIKRWRGNRWMPMAGGAWKKEWKEDNEKAIGDYFISITLDDDDMANKVYVAAYPDDSYSGPVDPEKMKKESVPFNVTWKRLEPQDEKQAA